MDLHRSRLSLLKIALPVLLGTTWMFVAFVMETRPSGPSASAIDRLARLPASISSGQLPLGPKPKIAEPVRMDTVELPCWDQIATGDRAVTARWVRLVGRNCKAGGTVVSVKNLANANVGTVLPEAKGQFTTDYMPLESGRNEILFTIESAPGVILESRLTLVR